MSDATTRFRNALRVKAILVAREFRELFMHPAEREQASLWRRVFLVDDGNRLKRAGEYALADLRDFCFAQKSTFDTDALMMARREGRRDVFLRITRYLNLDESKVEQLMEIDDGI